MVEPENTLDPALTPGDTYTIAINTDYAGSDIWSWQFELTFNTTVLQGIQVRNGNLITPANDSSAVFVPGTFDNTNGMISLSYAYFDYDTPPPYTTSGPGTLAYVDFNVTGYGSTDIELSDSAQLLNPLFAIIDAYMDPDNIGHGFLRNTLFGDANGDKTVDIFDIGTISAHWSPGPPVGPLGYGREADINLDGSVDIFDIGITSAHWGETAP